MKKKLALGIDIGGTNSVFGLCDENGTVYFDVEKYNKEFQYGQLTNRKLEELLEGTRELSGQDEKKGRLDFALWIVAKPETLMKWPSPWGWSAS